MESLLEKSFECLREKQCRSYLDRLGLEYPRHLDREFLDRLVRRHLEVIPFENLTQVVCHKTVSMDLEQIYEKIVLGRRGGYCFELNSLFLGLVRGLGYKGYPVACRVLRRPGLRVPTHRANVVCLGEEEYFCDVGFGGIACLRGARMDCSTVTETEFGSFFFQPEYKGWLNLWHIPNGEEKSAAAKIMMVAQIPSAPIDFAAANAAMCGEDSIFTQGVMVQRMTQWGPFSIDGDQYTSRGPEGKKVVQISSDRELETILKDVFGIELPQKV